jgi:hypothetical protein
MDLLEVVKLLFYTVLLDYLSLTKNLKCGDLSFITMIRKIHSKTICSSIFDVWQAPSNQDWNVQGVNADDDDANDVVRR